MKIILFSSFTSTREDIEISRKFSGRLNSRELYENQKKFSVLFIITNLCENNWISNSIDIHKESDYTNEKEYLFQPFSFYFVKDVQIDLNNYTADIYLETIGKKEILEEKIRLGKTIEYNAKEKIMQIKK